MSEAPKMKPADLAGRLDATILKPEALSSEVHRIASDAMQYGCRAVVAAPVWTERLAKMVKGSGVRVVSTIAFPFGTAKSTVKAIEATSTIKDGADRLEIVPHHALLLTGEADGTRAELIEIARAARATRRDVHLATLVDVGMLLDRRGERAIEAACRVTRTGTWCCGILVAAERSTYRRP